MNSLVCAVCAFTGDVDYETDVMVIAGTSVCMDHASYVQDGVLSLAIAKVQREARQ